MRAIFTLVCLVALSAVGGTNMPERAKAGVDALQPGDSAATRGLAFAGMYCSACHAVNTGNSREPAAPPFEAVVNVPGLTAETLKSWLRDSHNYPEVMNFEIAAAQIDDLSSYMLTLQHPDYRPPIQ